LNAKPFCGYWFIGAANNAQRAAFYSSWGLLDFAPTGAPGGVTLLRMPNIPVIPNMPTMI